MIPDLGEVDGGGVGGIRVANSQFRMVDGGDGRAGRTARAKRRVGD